MDQKKIKRYLAIFVCVVLLVAYREHVVAGVMWAWDYVSGIFSASEVHLSIDSRAQRIFACLDSKSILTLEDQFSEYVIKNNTALKDQISALYSAHGGEVTTFKGMRRSVEKSGSMRWYVGQYEVENRSGRMIIFFIEIIESPDDPSMRGLHYIHAVPRGNERKFIEDLSAYGVFLN